MTDYKIVVADDNEIFRTGIISVIKRTCAQPNAPKIEIVAEATRGEMAFDFALQYKPDVLLLDISMPDEYGHDSMNGIDVVEALNERKAGINVLIMSNYTQPTYIRRLLNLGVSGYAYKDDLHQASILVKALINVAKGEKGWMTPRIGQELTKNIVVDQSIIEKINTKLTTMEKNVLMAVGRGMDDEEIATYLDKLKEKEKVSKIKSKIPPELQDFVIQNTLENRSGKTTPHTVRSHRNNYRIKLQLSDRADEILFAFKSGLVFPEEIK